ncbi:hypothetical protein I4U23_007186 [Adineta vaga]|nr:hypothetical protein I4U23_007186 [Adineta vaga]
MSNPNIHLCAGVDEDDKDKISLIYRTLQEIIIEAGMYAQFERDTIIRQVDRVYIHRNYSVSVNSYNNYIAIFYLSKSLYTEHNSYVSSICPLSIGTILTESYILTAADCVDSLSKDITISHQLEQITRKVDRINIHPNWNSNHRHGKDNIALLHLSNPLNFTGNKQLTRIQVPTRFYTLNNTLLRMIDWIQDTKLLLLDNNDPLCNSLIDKNEQQFCVKSINNSQRDEVGQPIFQWINNRWMQVGIISSITKHIDDSHIDVVTSLHHYYHWLESIVYTQNHGLFNIANMADLTKNLPTTYKCNVRTVSCGCSAENVQLSPTKIIGGEEAIPRSWSMVVSIHYHDSDEPSCTGSILTHSYILTSAHCVDDASVMDLHIVAGVHNRVEDFPMIRYVQNIYIHPDWNRSDSTYRNDIALLYIFPPLPINGNGNPALTCVPHINPSSETVNYPSEGSHLVMVGWGSTQYGSTIVSNTLQQVSIDVIDKNDTKCLQTIHDVNKQFCAMKSGRDPCHGDLGGPIFQWKGTYWDQVGITSYGGQCDQIGTPGIFTRLASYFNWMESIINSSLTTTTPVPPPLPILHECNKASTCGCGKTDVVLTPSRIVGGEDALDNSWPMIVSVRLHGSKDHSCGGTILSKSFILTAAHCLRGISDIHPSGITIAAGMTNRSDPDQIIRNVDEIHIHPYYLGQLDDKRHDIALLHIDQPFEFESNVNFTKTCIHRLNSTISADQYPKNGTRLVVIGWGVLLPGTMYVPEILQQAQVFTIDNQDPICDNLIQASELQFCAGLYQGGKDSCQGDSGGPIFQWTEQYWEQVGIVSHGTGCAEENYPGIYTRLSYYYDWIQNILIRNGEHLESGIFSDTTTTTSMSATSSNTISSFRSSSITLYNICKYQFNIMICGLVLLLCFLYY